MIDIGTHEELFPVLDEQRKLAGVVHLNEIMPVLLDKKLAGSLVVFDTMDKVRGEISVEADLAEAMNNLEKYKLDYLPVRAKSGEFIGFISRSSIFKLYRSVLKDQY